MDPIPAVWRIDVEPDHIDAGPGRPWHGFVAMAGLVGSLRARLEDLEGAPVCLTWLPRFDPGIDRTYGQPGFVFDRYRGLFDKLRTARDVFGIHVHYHRWDAERRVTFSDHADLDWTSHCVDASIKTFDRCFGEPARRGSHGGYFLDDAVAWRSMAAGIEVDVTPEPGLGPLSSDPSFGAYATAPSPDFREFPRRPYYPERTDLRVPAASQDSALPMMLLPLTAYDYEGARAPWVRRLARKVRMGPGQHRPLNPWKEWTEASEYWDLMERAADEGPARYIAFAVRTDAPSSRTFRQAQALFEYLPRHPIARRLRFVDPLSPEIRALARAGMRTQTAR